MKTIIKIFFLSLVFGVNNLFSEKLNFETDTFEVYLEKYTFSCADSVVIVPNLDSRFEPPYQIQWEVDSSIFLKNTYNKFPYFSNNISLTLKTYSFQTGVVKLTFTDANGISARAYTNVLINGNPKTKYEAGWSSLYFRPQDSIKLVSEDLVGSSNNIFYFLKKEGEKGKRLSFYSYNSENYTWEFFETPITNISTGILFENAETAGVSYLFYKDSLNSLNAIALDKNNGQVIGNMQYKSTLKIGNVFDIEHVASNRFSIAWLENHDLMYQNFTLENNQFTFLPQTKLLVSEATFQPLFINIVNHVKIQNNGIYYFSSNGNVYSRKLTSNGLLEEIKLNNIVHNEVYSKLVFDINGSLFYWASNKLHFYKNDQKIGGFCLNDSMPNYYKFYADESNFIYSEFFDLFFFSDQSNIYQVKKLSDTTFDIHKATSDLSNDYCLGNLLVSNSQIFYISKDYKIKYLTYPNLPNTNVCPPRWINGGYNFYSIADKDPFLSINKRQNSNRITIFPNPSSSSLFFDIDSDFTVKNYSILNAHGTEVISKNEYIPNYPIDVSFLEIGVYFVKLESEKEFSIFTFVKR